jgi:AraC family transcriptional activator of pobA
VTDSTFFVLKTIAMETLRTIQQFKASAFNSLGDDFKQQEGNFNLYRRKEYDGPMELAYGRSDYYSISLIAGPISIDYADHSLQINGNVLMITNPRVPFGWRLMGDLPDGFACVFSEMFLERCAYVRDYLIFQLGNLPVFSLTDRQMVTMKGLFEKIAHELQDDFIYKYDAIRNVVQEIFFEAIRLSPVTDQQQVYLARASQVVSSFTRLLNKQFIGRNGSREALIRNPAAFAERLAISVNYLNRNLKEATGKTTSQLIAERFISEAKSLLKHSNHNVKEIASLLDFDDVAHFINFFKKMEDITPRAYRKRELA